MRLLSCVSLLAGWAALGSVTLAQDFKIEPGFTLLFNGKNLDGWKTKTGGKSLDGQTDAYKGRFKVTAGILVIDPKVKGDVVINTAKEFDKDVHIKFDFLPGTGCNNDLFFRGIKFDIIPKAIKNVKLDEWNQFEIIARGSKVEYKCNGETQRTATAKITRSPLGIRAEFGPIQLRRIRYGETP